MAADACGSTPAGYLLALTHEHPVVVTNFPGHLQRPHRGPVMAFVLAFSRGLQRFIPPAAAPGWIQPPVDEGMVHLPEATVLVVGVGGIGAEAARLCDAFGMTVLPPTPGGRPRHPVWQSCTLLSARPAPPSVRFRRAHRAAHAGHRGADARAPRFQRMRPTAFFINIGRGRTTRLNDLVEAPPRGWIAAPGWTSSSRSPSRRTTRCGHCPTCSSPARRGLGPYLDERRYQIIAANCRAFAAGRPLRNVVDEQACSEARPP